MINFNCFALSAVDDSVAETTQKAQAFFSRDNLTELFNEAVKWTADKIFQIILSLILWKVGKHVMKWLLKICSKALERAGFENGVIKFINSVLRFVCYAVMVMMVLDILGFQTASLIAVFGSAALALSMSLQGSLANFAGGSYYDISSVQGWRLHSFRWLRGYSGINRYAVYKIKDN